MVSLVDIVPQTRMVQITGGELMLRGLGLRQIADLLLSFPYLRNMFTPNAPEIDFSALIVAMPDAVGAIIAEAAGQPEAAESVATNLGADDVLECLQAVFDLTMPRGPAPFLQRLEKLFGGAASPYGKAPVTSGPPLPNGSSQSDTIQP